MTERRFVQEVAEALRCDAQRAEAVTYALHRNMRPASRGEPVGHRLPQRRPAGISRARDGGASRKARLLLRAGRANLERQRHPALARSGLRGVLAGDGRARSVIQLTDRLSVTGYRARERKCSEDRLEGSDERACAAEPSCDAAKSTDGAIVVSQAT
jgi:hypothetical protein